VIRRKQASTFLVYLIYLLALAMTTALLVFWVLVVQRFQPEINQLISRIGVEWNHFHWFIHSTGAALFFLVIVALTFLLAVTLAERRYSKKREELISTVTHELKTPMAAIRLHAQTLQQDDIAEPERQQFIGYIVSETERVSALVDNLLEASRLVASSGPKEPLQPIHLGDFFREYQGDVRERFDLKGVQLNFEIRSRTVVMATSETLSRVMDNLIANALRFTDAGGEVLCRVIDSHESAHIVVSDDGVGIPKEELTRVFDRFYQLRRSIGGRSIQGTVGLGLAIVRTLVEDMRGKIRAISGDDEPGTRFEIHLPEANAEEQALGELARKAT
jgi:two-component system phosphate regulon sensor histidine kinase PhoR